MRIELHCYLHADAQMLGLLRQILNKETAIMADLSALTAAVARITTVEASAIELLQGLKQKLDEALATNDAAALAALSDQLGADADRLAAAVAANTPAASSAPDENLPEPA